MTAPAPKVSILMAVRDGLPYVREAVQSMLGQQGVEFEFVIVDDKSTDGTREYLEGLGDPRIVIVSHTGQGLVSALNQGIAALRGDYVARMDSDDVSLPGRLAKQAAMLDADPELDLVHASARVIDGNGDGRYLLPAKVMPRAGYRELLLGEKQGKPIINPTVMMRRSSLLKAGGYRDSVSCEDHEFWLRVVEDWKMQAIPEVMVLYRQHNLGISRTRTAEQAISHITNCVAYRYRMASGIDLYDDDPARYAWLRRTIGKYAAPQIDAMVHAKTARRHLRQGAWAKGLRALASLLRTGRLTMLSNRLQLGAFHKVEAEVLEHYLLGPGAGEFGESR